MVYLKSEYLMGFTVKDERRFNMGSWDRLTPVVSPSPYHPTTIRLSNESKIKTHTGRARGGDTAHTSVAGSDSQVLGPQGEVSQVQEVSDVHMAHQDRESSTGMGTREGTRPLDEDIQLIEVTYT